MKKLLLLLLLLFPIALSAQKTDIVNEVMFSYIKNIEIESEGHKELVLKELDKISKKTKDSLLVKKVNKYKKIVQVKKIDNISRVKYNELDKKDLRKFRESYDDFKGIRFIYSKRDANTLYPYIGIKNGKMYMRLITKYRGNGWIFAERAKVIINENVYAYDLGETDREVTSGSHVEEKSDINVDEYHLDMLRKIAKSDENLKFRMVGDKSYTSKLRRSDIRKIREVIELYDKLKNTLE